MREGVVRSFRLCSRLAAAVVTCFALGVPLPAAATGQATPADEALAEEVVVVESSILLQRAARTRAENLEVAVDDAVAEAVAVYPLVDIGFSTTVYFDLCAPSFSRLTHAVGMVAAVGEQMLEIGPVSVVASRREDSVLLQSSRDRLDFEAALATVLRSSLGGCKLTSPLAGMTRMRRVLGQLEQESTAPSLLLVYGLDHRSVTAEDLKRFESDFVRAGRELAAEGRTTVVLVPEEGDTRLKEEEIRPLLGDPEEPPRTVDLGAILGFLMHRKKIVPNDPRILALATDPRNELLRELIAPSQGRLFAFPRQLEAFAIELGDYQVLYYRSRLRETDRDAGLASIEVRTRSGEIIPAAVVTSHGRPDPPAAD